jgi:hypothetical protein
MTKSTDLPSDLPPDDEALVRMKNYLLRHIEADLRTSEVKSTSAPIPICRPKRVPGHKR